MRNANCGRGHFISTRTSAHPQSRSAAIQRVIEIEPRMPCDTPAFQPIHDRLNTLKVRPAIRTAIQPRQEMAERANDRSRRQSRSAVTARETQRQRRFRTPIRRARLRAAGTVGPTTGRANSRRGVRAEHRANPRLARRDDGRGDSGRVDGGACPHHTTPHGHARDRGTRIDAQREQWSRRPVLLSPNSPLAIVSIDSTWTSF